MKIKKSEVTPKISIIIPVYNVQEYLGKCLSNLLSQTLENIEIICINDGSTDGSLSILQNFAARDKRIKVINKENEGVSAARNAGLDVACGEYLMFVDGDDWIEPETCEECYKKIVANNADLLVFNHFEYFLNKSKLQISSSLKDISESTFTLDNAPLEFFDIMTGVWGKLYKNKQIPSFNTNLVKGEDTVFFWEYCINKNPKITILDVPFYYYLIRENSAMQNKQHVLNCEIVKSALVLMNSDCFCGADERIQANIMNRFAKSLWWEIKNSKCKLTGKYFDSIKLFLHKTEYYHKTQCLLPFFEQLKKIYAQKKHPLLNKIMHPFVIENKPRHKVISIFGVFSLKIKRIEGRLGAEQHYIRNVRKNYKKYPKDTYLLFDCLHDETAEAIDAYSLFEKMREKGIPAYYVLRKQTALYQKLADENKLENVIVLNFSTRTHPNEFMQKIHQILYRTKCILTSFGENSGTVEMFFRRHPSWQYIFLQHGPTFMKESVLYNGYLYPAKFDKFLICSDREENVWLKYNFPKEKLIKVGLPRWDLLKNLPQPKQKSILLMLTWRGLNSVTFENSLYKKNLLNLLHNKKLNSYLSQNNITLYFAPHHALLGNAHINFDLSEEKNIQIVDGGKVSQYIRQCSCLLTDLSSVAFDFMFQNKPVVFYILDKDDRALNRFDAKDLAGFDYKQYILSDVFFNEDAVVNRVIEYCENNFKIDERTHDIYNSFFYTKENIREQLIEKLEEICKN